MTRGLSRRSVCLTAAALATGRASAAPALRYVRAGTSDRFGHYAVELIDLALGQLGLPALAAVDAPLTPGRIARELRDPQGRVDVMWGMASAAMESEQAPVRFALDRGLLGYRLLLARGSTSRAWQELAALPDAALAQRLARLPCGSGEHWPDTGILRANGWTLRTTTRAGALFRMLAAGRIDVLPRSALEILPELEAHRGLGLQVVPDLAVAYPAVSYLCLGPRHAALAPRLQAALLSLSADGRIEHLFERHFGAELRRLDAQNRRVLWLQNPLRLPGQALPTPPVPWLRPPAT